MTFPAFARKLALLVLVAVLVIAALPTQAQSSLPDDQAETLEYMLETLGAAEDFTAFNVTATESRNLDLEVFMGGQSALKQQNSAAIQETGTYVDDGQLGNIVKTSVVNGASVQGDVTTAYVINAETRVVDGTVYLNAAYETPDPSLPALPDGWTVLDADAEATYPGISDLDLSNILGSLESGEPVPFTDNFEEFADGLRAAATEVVMEEGATTEDGRTGTAYVATLGADGLSTMLSSVMGGEDADVMVSAMVDNLGPDSEGTFGILVDEDGVLAELVFHISIVVADLDVSALDPNVPAGTTANMTLEVGTLLTVTDVDADLPLTEAPM